MTGRSPPALLRKGAFLGTLMASYALTASNTRASPPVEGPARPNPTQHQDPSQYPATSAEQTRRRKGKSQQTNTDATTPSPVDKPNPSVDPEGPKSLPPPRLDFSGPMPASAQSREQKNLGLHRQHDGSYLYIDPYKRFTATFNRDGTVYFADRWRRPDKKNSQRGALGGLPRGLFGPMGMSVNGPSEWVMALQGIDPNARVKAELLARTREIRIALAIDYTRELLAHRLNQLGGELEGLWASTWLNPSERRALLFQRWDECDETFAIDSGDVPKEALSAIDSARIKTAEEARRTIENFIRTTLPKGHADAYSSSELRALNRRRASHQTFAPYTRQKN
ncbi:MAG TPA: hypothetical protein ENK31_05465 [Nannocystis exedens]|nr:hypothetical protein [Nannocystis exedens]